MNVCRLTFGVFALVVALGQAVPAQQSANTDAAHFDAASVKPTAKGDPRGEIETWSLDPSGVVRFNNATLRLIIANAYGIDVHFSRTLIAGGDDLLSQRFDIQAKGPAAPAPVSRERLRTLLAERFGLRTHVEQRPIPVFALTLAREGKPGRDLVPSDIDCAKVDIVKEPSVSRASQMCGRLVRRDARAISLHESGTSASLARRIEQYVERPVDDETGLSGLFEWNVAFAVERTPAPDADLPSLETAIQDSLGLKLVPRAGTRDVLVVDSVKAPTAD